jgi:hypothetical protein
MQATARSFADRLDYPAASALGGKAAAPVPKVPAPCSPRLSLFLSHPHPPSPSLSLSLTRSLARSLAPRSLARSLALSPSQTQAQTQTQTQLETRTHAHTHTRPYTRARALTHPPTRNLLVAPELPAGQTDRDRRDGCARLCAYLAGGPRLGSWAQVRLGRNSSVRDSGSASASPVELTGCR